MPEVVNQYRCDDCSWIYRPQKHKGKDLFDDQDDGWVCPQCGAERDHFQVVVPPDDDLTPRQEDEDYGASVDAGVRVIYARNSTLHRVELTPEIRFASTDVAVRVETTPFLG